MPGRHRPATQGHQTRFLRAVQNWLTRWPALLLAFDRRFETFQNVALANLLNRHNAGAKGFGNPTVDPSRSVLGGVGLQEHLRSLTLLGRQNLLAQQCRQLLPFLVAQPYDITLGHRCLSMLGPGAYPYARTGEIGQTGLAQTIKIEATLAISRRRRDAASYIPVTTCQTNIKLTTRKKSITTPPPQSSKLGHISRL